MKGSDLWSAICEGRDHRVPSPCQIKLAKSEVDHNCMLLILVGERGQLSQFLQLSSILVANDPGVGSGRGDWLWGDAVGCSLGGDFSLQLLLFLLGSR